MPSIENYTKIIQIYVSYNNDETCDTFNKYF